MLFHLLKFFIRSNGLLSTLWSTKYMAPHSFTGFSTLSVCNLCYVPWTHKSLSVTVPYVTKTLQRQGSSSKTSPGITFSHIVAPEGNQNLLSWAKCRWSSSCHKAILPIVGNCRSWSIKTERPHLVSQGLHGLDLPYIFNITFYPS